MSRIHTHPVCQNCISLCHIKNSCREQSSEFFGGSISPFHLSCPQYIGLGVVYAPKNRPKKWFKVRTMEDMDNSRARLY